MATISPNAQATEQQVRALEGALLEQFYLIVQGLTLYWAMRKKYGDSSAEVKKYSGIIFPAINKWIKKEGKYESEMLKQGYKGGILASKKLKYDDFFKKDKLGDLWKLSNQFNKEKQVSGMGFIPLLVWAIIAIVTSIAAVVITDDLTTTTEEKSDLMEKTQQTCKDLGLSTEQCAKMISETQEQAGGSGAGAGIGDMIKLALYALLGFGVYKVATDK